MAAPSAAEKRLSKRRHHLGPVSGEGGLLVLSNLPVDDRDSMMALLATRID